MSARKKSSPAVGNEDTAGEGPRQRKPQVERTSRITRSAAAAARIGEDARSRLRDATGEDQETWAFDNVAAQSQPYQGIRLNTPASPSTASQLTILDVHSTPTPDADPTTNPMSPVTKRRVRTRKPGASDNVSPSQRNTNVRRREPARGELELVLKIPPQRYRALMQNVGNKAQGEQLITGSSSDSSNLLTTAPQSGIEEPTRQDKILRRTLNINGEAGDPFASETEIQSGITPRHSSPNTNGELPLVRFSAVETHEPTASVVATAPHLVNIGLDQIEEISSAPPQASRVTVPDEPSFRQLPPRSAQLFVNPRDLISTAPHVQGARHPKNPYLQVPWNHATSETEGLTPLNRYFDRYPDGSSIGAHSFDSRIGLPDHSDPRTFFALDVDTQNHLWDALQPTVDHFQRITGSLPQHPTLEDGYDVAYHLLGAQLRLWIAINVPRGDPRQLREPALFKLDRWYGGIQDWRSAPNLGDAGRDDVT